MFQKKQKFGIMHSMKKYENFALKKLDRKITYFMQYKLSNPLLDKIMLFFTYMGNFCSLWILFILAFYFGGEKRYAYLMVIALLVTNAVNNGLLKAMFRRKRPFEQYEDITIFINDPYGSSFPSGHSATSFSAAVVIAAFHPIIGAIALFVAAGVAVSRLYLRVHFFTDVLCGVITGTLCSIFVLEYFMHFFM